MSEVITLQFARENGLKQYFTGKPCKHGHIAKRATVNQTCLKCVEILRKKNYEKYSARHREYIKEKYKNDPVFRKSSNLRVRKWYYAHLEEARKKSNKWAKENPAKSRVCVIKRRALKASVIGSFTETEIKNLFKKQKGKCAICKIAITFKAKQKNTLHRDHIIPLIYKEKSSNFISNIQLLCSSCNLKKGKMDSFEFAKKNGKLL